MHHILITIQFQLTEDFHLCQIHESVPILLLAQWSVTFCLIEEFFAILSVFFLSLSDRHRHQHTVVKWTFTITVFHVQLCQQHQHQFNLVQVQRTIHRSIQMQIQNEMRLHSVNNFIINTSRTQRPNLPRIYVINKWFYANNQNRHPLCHHHCVTVFKNKKESLFQT